MQRTLLFITSFVVLTGSMLFAVASPAYADLSAADQQRCYDQYNGKVMKTDKQVSDFRGSNCAKKKGGNCTLAAKGSAVHCTVTSPDGTTTSTTGETTAPSSPDGSGTVCDPALPADLCKNPSSSANKNQTTCNKNDCGIMANLINPLITAMSVLVGLALTIGMIWGGIQVSTSAGDPSRNAAGKGHIRNAIIAAVAYVFLYAFLQWLIPGGYL